MNATKVSVVIAAVSFGALILNVKSAPSSNFQSDRTERITKLVAQLSLKGYNPYSQNAVDLDELSSYGFDAIVEINNELQRIDMMKMSHDSRYAKLESFSMALKQMVRDESDFFELQFNSGSEARRFVAVRTTCLQKKPLWNLVKRAVFDESRLVSDLAIDLLRRGNIDY